MVLIWLQVTVILHHMFHPTEFEEDLTLSSSLEDDVKAECAKLGVVDKVRTVQASVAPVLPEERLLLELP